MTKSKRVIVCDDSKVIRMLVRDLLERDGWEVVAEAADGGEAIEFYKELKPEAMTLDLVMHDTNGLSVLEKVRQFDPLAKIVILSAVTHPEVVSQAMQRGAANYLCKPIVAEQLLDTMSACVC